MCAQHIGHSQTYYMMQARLCLGIGPALEDTVMSKAVCALDS